MKYALIIVTLFVSGFANASVFISSKQSPKLAAIVKKDRSLDTKIEKAIAKEVGAKELYGFSVAWDTLKCLAADASELSGSFGGVCTVTAGAMQVGAQIAIVKKDSKPASVSVIYADVE